MIDKILGGNIIGMNEIVEKSMNIKVWGGLVMALGFAFIGFLDDYIKVVKKRNMGLTILQKTVLQIVLMVGYLLTLFINDPTGSMFIPFVGMIETKIFFWVIGVAVIYCTTNAVNFTDGIDGLCGSVTVTAAVSFIVIGALRNCLGVSLLAAALAEKTELCEAATIANTASSIGVTRKYAVSSIPTRKEIEEILKCKRV